MEGCQDTEVDIKAAAFAPLAGRYTQVSPACASMSVMRQMKVS